MTGSDRNANGQQTSIFLLRRNPDRREKRAHCGTLPEEESGQPVSLRAHDMMGGFNLDELLFSFSDYINYTAMFMQYLGLPPF